MEKKIQEEDILREAKEHILECTRECVHTLLYGSEIKYKELSAIYIFSLIDSREITTQDIINTFAKELRKETI
jgi:hypothetical protein